MGRGHPAPLGVPFGRGQLKVIGRTNAGTIGRLPSYRPGTNRPLAGNSGNGRIKRQSEAVLLWAFTRMSAATPYSQPFPLTPQTASPIAVRVDETSLFPLILTIWKRDKTRQDK